MTYMLVLVFLIIAIFAYSIFRKSDKQTDKIDNAFYKAQLDELEKRKETQEISEEEYETTKAEIFRKILAVTARSQDVELVGYKGKIALVGIVVLAMAATVALYLQVGAYGYPDVPLEERKAIAQELYEERQTQSEYIAQVPYTPEVSDIPERYKELVAGLRDAVSKNPNDVVGLELLAQSEMRLGNIGDAIKAALKIIEIKGDSATSENYSYLASLMVEQASGYVSPEAESFFRKSLSLDKNNRDAQFFMGVMFAQNARPDMTFKIWSQILRTKGDEVWLSIIEEDIVELSKVSGVKGYEIPKHKDESPVLSSPSSEQVQMVNEMTPEERQEFIRNMVASLKDRLFEESGSVQEWARLINAMMVSADPSINEALGVAQRKLDENSFATLLDILGIEINE